MTEIHFSYTLFSLAEIKSIHNNITQHCAQQVQGLRLVKEHEQCGQVWNKPMGWPLQKMADGQIIPLEFLQL